MSDHPNSFLSTRVQEIKPSSTLEVAAKARKLRDTGKSVINLGVGEPDFDTPELIKEAAIKALKDGFTKYTAIEGTLVLREAIVHKFQRENQLQYTPSQILVSCGGKQSFYNLAQALLNPGDEVIIPAPYWVSYPYMVQLAQGKSVFIASSLEHRYKISPADLEAAISPKTKLFVLNSPSNPSGMAYTKEELQAFGKVLAKYPQVFIATDDMYEHILWEGKFHNILNACPELYSRTIVLHGVSKTYAMTGFRIGFAAGNENIIKAMAKIQGQSTSGPCSISQMAAKEALDGNQQCVQEMVQAYKERHDYFIPELQKIEGIEVLKGDGTFYTFARIEKLIERLSGKSLFNQKKQHDARSPILNYPQKQPFSGKMAEIQDDYDLAEFLLNEACIATVPGDAFGSPLHLRLSFATSLDHLKEAIQRLKSIC